MNKKHLPKILLIVFAFIVLGAFLLARSPDPNYLEVIQDKTSPDGILRAVYVLDTQGGAAVGTGQDVYILKGTEPFQYSKRIFSVELAHNVSIDWIGARSLKITFDIGSQKITSNGYGAHPSPYGVKIQLVPTVHSGIPQ